MEAVELLPLPLLRLQLLIIADRVSSLLGIVAEAEDDEEDDDDDDDDLILLASLPLLVVEDDLA
jgi:hypothetical protein